MASPASREVKLSAGARIAAVAGVVILAAVLRFFGLRWGLPDALHSYSYHPDEFLIVGAALCVLQKRLPCFYNYPSLFVYLTTLAIIVGSGYGLVGSAGGVYLCARVVAALMGVAAVAVTYWAGEVLFGASVGLLGALVLCIAPLHVQHSHFATVDVPSTVFVAASLGFAGLVLKRGSWRDYVLGGLAVGLAAGTKYNAVLVIFSLVAAHFAREGLNWKSIRGARIWASLGCVVLGFVVSTPGAVLDWTAFRNGVGYELAHSALGHGLVFAGTGSGFVYSFTSSLWYGLGPLLAIMFGVAALYAIKRLDTAALVLLAFVVPYYILISVSHVRFARYALPLFPAAAILCGWLMREVSERASEKGMWAARLLWIGVCVAVVLATLGLTMLLEAHFVMPDPRDAAQHWIFANVPKGSAIGVMEVPWFYSPPLSKTLGFGTLDQRRKAAMDTPYKLVVFSQCEKQGCWAQRNIPRWVVLSNYEVDDARRLRGNESISAEERGSRDRILTDLALVRERYVPRADFGGDWTDLLDGIPHDMCYPSPIIAVYELKK